MRVSTLTRFGLALTGAMLLAAPSANADLVTISGTDQIDDLAMRDNWGIWGEYGSAFLGQHPTNGQIFRYLLKFNVANNAQLLADGVTAGMIDKAEIVLYARVQSPNTVGHTYDLHRLLKDFDEHAFPEANTNRPDSWDYFRATGPDDVNGYPTVVPADAWEVPGAGGATDRLAAIDASFTTSIHTDWVAYRIDVTQYVKDVLNGAADYGWLLKGRTEAAGSQLGIRSSEGDVVLPTAGPPTMEITYTIPEPASLGLLSVGALLVLRRRH